MKDYVVVFSESGARIVKDPAFIQEHKNDSNVLLNPELPLGSPPHFWVKVGNQIEISKTNEHIKNENSVISSFVDTKVSDQRRDIELLEKQLKTLKIILGLIILGNILYVLS